MSESKKKKEEAPNGHKADWPLSRLLLDCTKDKYRLVTSAIRWAQEIKQRQLGNDTAQELVNKALREILTGQVDIEKIEKLPPLPKLEKKLSEAAKAEIEKAEAETKKEEK